MFTELAKGIAMLLCLGLSIFLHVQLTAEERATLELGLLTTLTGAAGAWLFYKKLRSEGNQK